jgi:hypothetical protein
LGTPPGYLSCIFWRFIPCSNIIPQACVCYSMYAIKTA